jgi:hypothetical protein
VEQGSVSSLVESSPEERRQFIEESAASPSSRAARSRPSGRWRRRVRTEPHEDITGGEDTLNANSRQAKRAEQYNHPDGSPGGRNRQMRRLTPDLTARRGPWMRPRYRPGEGRESRETRRDGAAGGGQRRRRFAPEGDLNRLRDLYAPERHLVKGTVGPFQLQGGGSDPAAERETKRSESLRPAEEFRREPPQRRPLQSCRTRISKSRRTCGICMRAGGKPQRGPDGPPGAGREEVISSSDQEKTTPEPLDGPAEEPRGPERREAGTAGVGQPAA